MGTRINKMIGYGLVDLEHDGDKVTDRRLHEDVRDDIFHRIPEQAKWSWTAWNVYLEWLDQPDNPIDQSKVRSEIALTQQTQQAEGTLHECIAYGGYLSALPSVLCVRPKWQVDWYRYDNIIDYVEANLHHPEDPCHDSVSVEILNAGIYPYSGWTNLLTKEKINSSVPSVYLSQIWRTLDVAEYLTEAAHDAGFPDLESAQKYLRPTVPAEVHNLCRFLDIFVDPDTVYSFVPMVYTWWS